MVLKIFYIIIQICGCYAFYRLGDWIQSLLRVPVPGSIIGMLVLFLLLLSGVFKARWLASGANVLLKYLSLILVPSVIGVMEFGSFFIHKGIWLVFLVGLNTMAIMALSSWISQRLSNKAGQKARRDHVC